MRNRWLSVLLACLLVWMAVEGCRAVASVRAVFLGPGLNRAQPQAHSQAQP